MKKIIIHTLNFVLTIGIFLLAIIIVSKATILNEKYVLNILEDNYYYNEVYDNVIDNFESNLIQSGIDEEIIYDLISQEKVESDIKNVVKGIYTNEEVEIDTTSIKETLDTKIDELFKSINRKPSKEEKKDIETLQKNIINVYEDEIAYKLDTLNNFSNTLYKINNIATMSIFYVSIIVLLLLLIETLLMNKYLKNIGISILSSGLILITIRLIIGSRFNNILMFNEIFSKTFVALVTDILTKILIIGIVLSIIGLILIIIGIYKKSFLNEVRKVK